MRTNPFYDTLTFLMAGFPDQTALGAWRWPIMGLFYALMLGSLFTAAWQWAEDPAQRTGRDLGIWISRVLVGCMWFQNLFWKLPVSLENGLHYWTGLEVTDAAFALQADLVRDVLLPSPQFLALNVLVLLVEAAFAVSLILGVGMRLLGTVGLVFSLQLWSGLYRNTAEWPWSYVFLALLMGLFALVAAGRSLGLDAALRRRYPSGLTDGAAGVLVRVAT